MLKNVKLRQARGPGHPDIDERDGYEFIAPLREDGRIDLDAWKSGRTACWVHRLEGGRIAKRGLLVHHAGGREGGTWRFDFHDEVGSIDESDAGYRFGDRTFAVGEYVSLRDEAEGPLKTYQVSSVTPVKG